MRRLPRRALLPTALLVIGCGPGGVVWQERPVSTEIEGPGRVALIEAPIPVAMVAVDGHPARFAVDTGADLTLLDEGFVARTGLPSIPIANSVSTDRGGAVARVYTHFSRVARLSIGDTAAAVELEPLVLDMSHLDLELDGILGMNVMRHWRMVFDDDRQTLHVLPPGEIADDLGAIFTGALQCWSWIERDHGERPFIRFELDAYELDALLDTGAARSSFTRGAIDALGLEETGATTSAHIGGVEQQPIYRVEQLSIGDTVFKDFDVDAHPDEYGLVGWDLLSNLVFVVDGPARLFCFTYQPQRPGAPDPAAVEDPGPEPDRVDGDDDARR